MAIAINGSGTITGISAGGLPDGVITTADLADNAVTYTKIGTTEQGQLCKAWVNFNGTGTYTPNPTLPGGGKIRASYNVSSVTKNGTGDYTVTFTTAMVDENYSSAIGGAYQDPAGFRHTGQTAVSSQTTSNCNVKTCANSSAAQDHTIVCLTIFR